MGDNDPVAIENAREALQSLLAQQARVGVPEQVLLGLLREQAVEIERLGYIPRQWEHPDQQDLQQR
ncbi:hypothetical protein DVK03_18840 [Haloferax sp. Atlit-109R]|jgi:hypothetical protein|uniref:hypothetical protein n=1 Tax=unclassified Haloferax TaxID=2625095 RepID=UPI000E25BAC7|nr:MULTISPECIES: hypothetical protein [unclassified Haloferax]RDZ32137.1 hypothetical protein C5B88_19025 [Haloferax sp. Atlit-24N]RLM33194.1 hypothetical protein DVK03_18840 [Haloferax sp. Atlit-109R]RLM40666.1 hypothetical protein DVK04_18905 [Haloferax sp. Atlit-105R]